MADRKGWVLTVTCPDTVGIISTVTSFLSQHECFITDASQYGDPLSRRFFLRVVFLPGAMTPPIPELEKLFTIVAARFQMIWRMHDASRKARVVILVSKFGHCLNDLLHRYQSGSLPIEIPAVISNHPDMQGIVEWHGIPYHYFPADKTDKAAQEAKVLEVIDKAEADLVVLARYMQILSHDMCVRLQGRAINIHHSFLPSFKGAKPYHQAHARGVKIIGATAHYVTADLDEGPIIEQGVERVDHTLTPEDLVALGRDIENVVLARAVRWHTEHRVLLNGSRTVVFRG
jgi:formyltetrahydrofolate deformylase